MQVRKKHNLGFISLIAVHALLEVCKADKKDESNDWLNSLLDQYPPRNTFIVFGDSSASTGFDRTGY